MKESERFVIGFKGLSLGEHVFEYQIDADFFTRMKNEELQDGDVQVKVFVEKSERLLSVRVESKGVLNTHCDRCLGDLKVPVDISEQVYVKFGDETREEADNVLIIADSSPQYDMSRMINEMLLLAKPMKAVHSQIGDDVCEASMIRKMEEYSEKREVDPRWAALQGIKDKLSNK